MAQHSTPPSRPRRKGRHGSRRSRRPLALRTGLIALTVAVSVAAAAPSRAQAPTRDQSPVLLVADQVTFDEEGGIVTARGNVELSQGLRTVRADSIVYNQRTRVVTATGNIRLVEPSGDILFADYAELTDDLRNAFINNIRMLMTDDGRMAGTEAERRGGVLTRVNRAVYSPCELCPTDRTRPPLWQIRAVRVVHDTEEKEVRYKDAVLEMFGVPVAYTPYLSHPDPTVDRKTGFLTPTFGNSSDLGLFLRSRYYVDIAPDQDATVEVGVFSKEGLLLGGEYRKRFENGTLQLNGSVTRSELPSAVPSERRDDWRGHIAARGLFDIDPTWRWGFDVNRASDETYLRRYYDVREDFLVSRAFVEGFRGRNYAALNAYAFQDLRYGNTTEEPLVLPLAQYRALGQPNATFGGRWSVDASVLGLYRKDGRTTQRIAVQPGWRREMVSSFGLVTTIDASVLVAGYHTERAGRAPDYMTGDDSSNRFRLFPQVQAMFRYPFVRYGESSSQLIEPLVAFTAAPNIDNDDIPNEDSRDVEFDETVLFRPNRFTGIDRLEGGSRVTYGFRTGIYGYRTGSASLFIGQSYRLTKEADFAAGSGLEERLSDYVGRLDLAPAPWLDVNYGFRLDQDGLRPRRHNLTASAGVPQFRAFTSYTYVDQTTDRNAVQRNEIEQASFGFHSRLSPLWTLSAGYIQAFEPDPGPRSAALVLTYQDECFTFETIARRDFTDVPGDDVNEGSTILFRLVFKNIGEVRTPGISTGFIGGGSQRD
ncbi:LPS-assembly protein LptD [Azospirillum halopraeferens]|uniref:LPS-assembly protein LptD n=1 Tax=Azospirillum halopraeferens TaxID=34010 RepID=UPI000404E1D2|nr:LPS assembly protein LptD [Azospirillum halopraeferens]